MCITNNLQRHIRNLTNDGEAVARFLYDTMEGKHPDAKYHHKLEAAKLLSRFGPSDADPFVLSLSKDETTSTPEELAEKNTPSPSMGEEPAPGEGRGRDGGDQSPLSPQESALVPSPSGGRLGRGQSSANPVSPLDILNYDIAHLIRQETADGHTIAQFFSQVMTGRDKPFTPKKLRIRHTDRMAAAREIIRRGFGHFGRRPKLVVGDHDDTNAYDTLHTDLAKRMREYTEHGTDAIRFLLDVMEDADPDDPYSIHHRVSAALELTRRGWDTNYDSITPEMLQDYWRDQHSTRLSVGHKKHLAGLPVFLDEYDTYDSEDYAALAANLREQEDLEAPSNRRSCGSRNPEGPGAGKEAANPFVLSLSKDLPPARSGDEPANNPETAANMPPLPPGDEPAPSESRGWDGSDESPLPLRGRVREGASSPSCPSMSIPLDLDDIPDCYYEPLNPTDQAIFDYELRLESGDNHQAEVPYDSVRGEPVEPPSPQAWRDYELALAHLKELAASEGVPLLPNPLSGTFRRPLIRSP